MVSPVMTRDQFLAHAHSKTNQRVTVPTNPYGGQCAAFVDYLTQYGTNKQANLAYTNAIDLLSTASRMGLQTIRWSGGNYDQMQVGDIWVTRTTAHVFGHTGIFTSINGQSATTLEQNVDGNWDALTNGGWVRAKSRWIRPGDGLMTYSDIVDTQYLVGWIRLPFSDGTEEARKKAEEAKRALLLKKKKGSQMYGSFIFTVKEGDGEFSKNAVYYYNAATNVVTGFQSGGQLKYVAEHYKARFGEDLPSATYTTKAPVYREIFGGLRTNTTYNGDLGRDILNILKSIQSGIHDAEILKMLKEASEKVDNVDKTLADMVSGKSIAETSKFRADRTINIRTLTDTNSKILGSLKKGDTVETYGGIQANGYFWAQIKYNGQDAYVATKQVGGETFGELIK